MAKETIMEPTAMNDDEEFYYRPDMRVVTSARLFIKSLCEVYGNSPGLAVWDKIRSNLSEQMASDIFLGMLTSPSQLKIIRTGHYKIEAIKEVRAFTGTGLKDAKDFIEAITDNSPGIIDISNKDIESINNFCDAMRKTGCVIN